MAKIFLWWLKSGSFFNFKMFSCVFIFLQKNKYLYQYWPKTNNQAFVNMSKRKKTPNSSFSSHSCANMNAFVK